MRDVLVQQPKFRKASTFLPRFLSASLLIPISLYCLYEGPPLSLGLGLAIAFGITLEWGRLLLKTPFSLMLKIPYALFGTAYIGTAILWLLQNLSLPEGWRITCLLLFLVWAADISAYVGGRFFKGPKLAPSISPNKTWSGFLIGVISGTLVSYGASFWLLPEVFTLGGLFALTCISQLGDLLESKAKRWSHLKDSSNLIPGHGGLLDRLDSLLAVAFTLALWQILF